MKNLIFFITLAFFTNAFSQNTKNITDTLKVQGNCEMCKKNIEESLLTKGVKNSSWDMQTHILTVTYNSDKISLDQIHQKVALSGYSTSRVPANTEAYNNLPDCCQYKKKK